jgi:hypothetical protein
MQLAERWLGLGMIVAAGLALAPPLLSSTPAPVAKQRVELTSYRCSEPRVPAPQAPAEEHREGDSAGDPYARVFENAQPMLQHCFRHESRVELLITIAPDGHVAKVSHRPDPSTPATRCLTNVIAQLQFPRSETTIAIRLPLTSR